jgi:hypothetical protein
MVSNSRAVGCMREKLTVQLEAHELAHAGGVGARRTLQCGGRLVRKAVIVVVSRVAGDRVDACSFGAAGECGVALWLSSCCAAVAVR